MYNVETYFRKHERSMKKYRIALLFIILLILLCGVTTLLLSSEKTTGSLPSMQEFISRTGFTGDYTAVNDGRIASALAGKFTLPIPRDSIALQANMDKIADAFYAVYQKQGAGFKLKRISYNDTYKSSQYIQYWKSFYLENQPYFLLVTYHPRTDTYSIKNTLYMQPIVIPEQVISLISVGRILSYITREVNVKADFPDFQPEYVTTDSIKAINEYGDNDYDKILIRLNLYPVYGDNGSEGFSLLWRYHKYYYHDTDYFIDAQTGNLTGVAAQEWQEKNILIKAAQDFINGNGLYGNCKFILGERSLAFYDIKVPEAIRDTLHFKQLTDKYVTALRKMYKQLGTDVTVDYQGIATNGNSEVMLYYATYVQKFRYPMFENFADRKYQVRITMDIISGILEIATELRAQPREYPRYVISPQAAIGIAKVMSKLAPGSLAYKTAVGGLIKDKVNINTIPYQNSYTEAKSHKVARLRVMPIYKGQTEDSAELKLAWYVNDNNRDTYCVLNPATGTSFYPLSPSNYQPIDTETSSHIASNLEEIKLVSTFLPLATISNFDANAMFPEYHSFEGKFHLPVAMNSTDFDKKCRRIMDILLKLNNMDTSDYTYEAFQDNGGQIYVDLYYKGYRVNIPWVGMYLESSLTGGYDADKNKFYVSYYLKPLDYQMPECVITPETAMAISNNKTNLPYAWTELANLSGTKDYAPASTGFGEGNDSFKLELYPFRLNNTATQYEYKLVWKPSSMCGMMGYIDAYTGQLLMIESYDSNL